ncbi:MAG TPA: hypothetical protein VFV27_03605 [Nevskiaceae bacterium]|nr:hypothetical protein [Nevskiaceae bacterium]
MKNMLDAGAALWALALVLAFVMVVAGAPALDLHGLPWGLLAFPLGAFSVVCLWHMIKNRRWYWFMGSLIAAPASCLVYYCAFMRKELDSHAARPAGEKRGQIHFRQ